MSDLSPEAAKILTARKAAVEELKALDGIERPLNDHLVQRLAGARLYAEGVTMRVIQGESVTAPEFKAANDMIEAAREAIPRKAIEARLTIVHTHYEPEPAPQPEPSTPKLLPAPEVIEGEVIGASNDATADEPARPAAPVYPKKDPATLGIHNARLPNGQPARMRRNDYTGVNAGGVYSPLEKAPDWSAAHPLPSPPPECFGK